jgi:hypothetical protein
MFLSHLGVAVAVRVAVWNSRQELKHRRRALSQPRPKDLGAEDRIKSFRALKGGQAELAMRRSLAKVYVHLVFSTSAGSSLSFARVDAPRFARER